MPKKSAKRASPRSPKAKTKQPLSPPLLGSLFRGLVGLFREDLPESEYRGSGRCETEVVGTADYQANLEDIAGGRSAQPAKLAVNARVLPDLNLGVTHVLMRGKRVGYLKPADAKFLAKQLEKAGVWPCSLKVTAVILGGRVKKNGTYDNFSVKLCLPPKPEKKPPTVETAPEDD